MNKLILTLFVLPLAFFSCKKKDKDKPCQGHFVTFHGGGGNPNWALWGHWLDPQISRKLYFNIEPWDGEDGRQAYDYRQNIFYCFTNIEDTIILKRYYFDQDIKQNNDLTYVGSMDSFTAPYNPATVLFCNTKANKLYYVYYDDWADSTTDRIFELKIAGKTCSEKLIYTAPHNVTIGSPLVDEITGYIYFVSGKQLLKVDPNGGMAATTTVLNNVRPCELHFSAANGMFYGVDTATIPRTFIRINPANGESTKLSDLAFINPNYQFIHSFDECSNQYIIPGNDVRFIDLNSGKVVKEYLGQGAPGMHRIYIND